MICPFCGQNETHVTDTRNRKSGAVRRRRECLRCGEVFRTDELLATENIKVKKQDSTVEDYDRGKVAKGIEKAAWSYNKRIGHGRLAPSDVNSIVDRVEAYLRARGARMVRSVEIGHLVLQELTAGMPGVDVVRIRYAIVFQGRTTRGGGFRGLSGLMEWIRDVYGDSRQDRPTCTPWMVKKRDGSTELFRQKALEASIGVAAKGNGTDNSVYAFAERLADEARRNLEGQALVTSQQIAAEVLKLLIRERDELAYLRYASAVKRYESVNDFWLEAYGLNPEIE